MAKKLSANEQSTQRNELVAGIHGPVTIDVRVESQQALKTYHHLDAKSDGLSIHYYGHKDDLLAAGCMKFSGYFGRFHDDGHGGAWWIASKAGPGKRGFVAVTYYTWNRAFAVSLPGVREMFSEELSQLAAHRSLRLVVDNTKENAHG